MPTNHMTHWIEIADERHFLEEKMMTRPWAEPESHFLHLGAKIIRVASWVQRTMHVQSPSEAPH